MAYSTDAQLTPEALAVLRAIEEETKKLKSADLADVPPAGVFEAD